MRAASYAGGGGSAGVERTQKTIAAAVRQEAAREVDRLVTRVLEDRQRHGHLDLEATETAIRAAMHQVGGVLLERLLNADGGGYRGVRIPCGAGHSATFIDSRRKAVRTVLGPVAVRRAYYHCNRF